MSAAMRPSELPDEPPSTDERDRRIADGVPIAQAFAQRWIRLYRLSSNYADDIVSDCLYVMTLLADKWRPDGGLSWSSFVERRIGHALIDELRHQHGRSTGVYASERGTPIPVVLTEFATIDERGYAEVETCDAIERILTHYPPRTREIMWANVAGLLPAEIARLFGISERRAGQIINGVRDREIELRAVRRRLRDDAARPPRYRT